MEENKKTRLDAQNENADVQTDTEALNEDADVLEQMKKYLADAPEQMAREAEKYLAEHPDAPEETAARKDRFFARLDEEKAGAEETAATVSEVIDDPLPEEYGSEAASVKAPFYRRRSFKVLAAVAACLVVLIAVPMVSQSARTAMQSVFVNIFGSGASGFTYDEATFQPLSEEEQAWNEIAETLGIEKIGFDERPDDLKYNKCEINEKTYGARVFYIQNNEMIRIDVQKQISTDMKSGGVYVDHETAGEAEIPLIGQMVTIYYLESEGKTRFYAPIQGNGAMYTVYFYDDLDAMKEFLGHIYFF